MDDLVHSLTLAEETGVPLEVNLTWIIGDPIEIHWEVSLLNGHLLKPILVGGAVLSAVALGVTAFRIHSKYHRLSR